MLEDAALQFNGFIDLISERIGGKALLASDEFFAPKENLLKSGRGVFLPDKYTDRGKWMDGWESRRKRVPGHDWCILRMGIPGRIHGVDIDTNHFLGNHPPFASIEAASLDIEDSKLDPSQIKWTEILPRSPLKPGSQNLFPVGSSGIWTHLRLNIYPDGGVARFRVYGEIIHDWDRFPEDKVIDLALVNHGAKVVACSDMFFSPMSNLIMPYSPIHMGDGWETKRRRGPGFDWVVVQLGTVGTLEKVEIHTDFFKGNYPDRCRLEGAYIEKGNWDPFRLDEIKWREILPETKLKADYHHLFQDHDLLDTGSISHVRLCIYPDGGISRLRLYGKRVIESYVHKINAFTEENLKEQFLRCCGSEKWVEKMREARPFTSATQLHEVAEKVWWSLSEDDWKEAFKHHPRIGDVDSLRQKFKETRVWARAEQSGIQEAKEQILKDLAEGNQKYEEKFGYIFIICATGKSATEMLTFLNKRLAHHPVEEIRMAAGEQLKITQLRLAKL